MSIIYEPSGKALEYSPLAANLFTGCEHRCKYCYCPSIRRMSMDEWGNNIYPRKNVLREFEKDAIRMRGDTREILFSFMTDPYQSTQCAEYTSKALAIAAENNLTCQILTKNPELALTDAHIIKKNKWKLASTIISLDDNKRKIWEPGAPNIDSRISALKEAAAYGIKTWVSIEPVIYPEDALSVIEKTSSFANKIKIGKWNHDENAKKIDWGDFAEKALRLLGEAKVSYYVKNDLWLLCSDKTKETYKKEMLI